MMNNTQILKHLQAFGLEERQSKIYLLLLEKGELTPLELARETDINRTTIYRLLEDLKKLSLVEEIIDQYKVKLKAASPESFQLLIVKKESDINSLKNVLPSLVSSLESLVNKQQSPTKVLYFRGENGLRQLLWNTLKASGRTEVIGYGYADWAEAVGYEFAENLRSEYVQKSIYSREIQNPEFNPQKDILGWTENEEYVEKYFKLRCIPESKLEINHDSYIYNDVFAFSYFFNDETFGVEIHNEEIAKTQRQIFNILWDQAVAP